MSYSWFCNSILNALVVLAKMAGEGEALGHSKNVHPLSCALPLKESPTLF